MTAQGIPDINACCGSTEVWIESKKVDGLRVDISPFQVQWLITRWMAGGRTYVFALHRHSGGPRKGAAVNNLLIFPGILARQLKDDGINGPFCWVISFDSPTLWQQVHDIVFNQPRGEF